MNAKRFSVILVVALMLLLSACAPQESIPCQTECPDAVAIPNNTDASINNSNTITINVDAGAGASTTGQDTQAQATAEASVFVAPDWDDTCVEQSILVGVELKQLPEGSFFACVYNGEPVTVSIPSGMIADLDLGGIYVAMGPVEIKGVSNLTLRPMRNGSTIEACNQVDALTAYGQSLPDGQKFEAQPYNFVCP